MEQIHRSQLSGHAAGDIPLPPFQLKCLCRPPPPLAAKVFLTRALSLFSLSLMIVLSWLCRLSCRGFFDCSRVACSPCLGLSLSLSRSFSQGASLPACAPDRSCLSGCALRVECFSPSHVTPHIALASQLCMLQVFSPFPQYAPASICSANVLFAVCLCHTVSCVLSLSHSTRPACSPLLCTDILLKFLSRGGLPDVGQSADVYKCSC